AQLGADVHRAIAPAGAVAHDAQGEAGIVLPPRLDQFGHRCLDLARIEPARGQFLGEFLARMLTPDQQGQRALQGRGRLAFATPARRPARFAIEQATAAFIVGALVLHVSTGGGAGPPDHASALAAFAVLAALPTLTSSPSSASAS